MPTAQPIWTDVLTAVGTVAAVVVALGFGIYAEIRLSQDRRSAREAATRAQAIRVSAWLDVRYPTNQRELLAIVRNSSDTTVWDIRVAIPPHYDTKQRDLWQLDMLPPDDQEETLLNKLKASQARSNPSLVPPRKTSLAVSFRDSAGRRWSRSVEGSYRPTNRRHRAGRESWGGTYGLGDRDADPACFHAGDEQSGPPFARITAIPAPG